MCTKINKRASGDYFPAFPVQQAARWTSYKFLVDTTQTLVANQRGALHPLLVRAKSLKNSERIFCQFLNNHLLMHFFQTDSAVQS